jgi:hypothetical protein
MTFKRRADPLRYLAVRMQIPDLGAIARSPGVSEAYRVTIAYHDGRHPDQVATLKFIQGAGTTAELTVQYRRATDKPFVLTPHVPLPRCREFAAALRALQFDSLDDMLEIPWHGVDLWLVERASGTFFHDVVIAPDRAEGPHLGIVTAIRELLREATRAIAPL